MANYTVICVYQISLDPNYNSEAAIKKNVNPLRIWTNKLMLKKGN